MSHLSSIKEMLFHSFNIALISLFSALVYALYATLKFSGDKLTNQYYYVVPIVVPFVVFVLKRLETFRQRTLTQKFIDFAVVLIAMWRVIGDVPYISGHTLFLTHCLITLNSRFGKVISAIVLLETFYLKVFVWDDWLSAVIGAFLGLLASYFFKITSFEKESL